MRRLRFPLLVLFAFGVAYGVTWFAIREKYRVSPTPAHAAVASSETRIEHFRRVLEKETNLLRGTAEMVALIPQLDGKDCQILEEDLIRASSLNAPILHQCAALFACQRANRIAALELSVLETMSAPSIREPFARGIVFARPNPTSADASRSHLTIGDYDDAHGQFYSPIQWALTWLGQHDRAKAYSLIHELGPQWQESASEWLVDFAWRDGLPDKHPFLGQIELPARDWIAGGIIARWRRFQPSAEFSR